MITRRYSPQIGGAERAIERLAQGFVQRGHQVILATESHGASNREKGSVTSSGKEEHTVQPVFLKTSQHRFLGTLLWIKEIRKLLRKDRNSVDVIYVSMLKHAAGAALSLKSHTPVILRPSGSSLTGDVAWQKSSFTGRVLANYCRQAHSVIALSPQIRQELVDWHYGPEKIREITGGVPISVSAYDSEQVSERRKELPIEALRDSKGALVTYVGRFSDEKGVKDLLESWKSVIRVCPDASLLFIGEGPLRGYLEVEINRQGWTSCVHVCGPVREVEPYLRASDLFVLPSHQEGVSNALLEALGLGIGVVATEIPGNCFVTQNGIHAEMVSSKKPEEIAKGIIEMLNNPEKRHHMGIRSREHVKQNFSFDRVVDEHEALFKQAISERVSRKSV